MDAAALTKAGIPVAEGDVAALLQAQAALEWMRQHTTLQVNPEDAENIAALPACAKLFVVKFCETLGMREGVTGQSIEGLSLSYGTADKTALLWQLARSLLDGYLVSQVRVIPAKRRW